MDLIRLRKVSLIVVSAVVASFGLTLWPSTTADSRESPVPLLFSSQHAQWSPDGAHIAFATDRDGDSEIYVMDADGANPRRLTHSPGRDAHPFWSPDGQWIVFQSPRDDLSSGDVQIYLMRADGSEQTPLTDLPGFAGVPAWSPDGRRIVFQFRPGGVENARWELRSIDLNAPGVPARLTDGSSNDQVPNWSPDGNRIVFHSDRTGRNELYTAAPDGSGLVRLTFNDADDSSGCWSPDGRELVFKSDREGTREIYVAGFQAGRLVGTPVRISQGTDSHGVPCLSPDGTRVLLHSAISGEIEVYSIARDGTGLRQLTDGSAGR